MKKKAYQKPEMYTLKNAIRKCGHLEDYSNATEHRLIDYAKSIDCTACRKAEGAKRKAREEERRQIALKWVSKHGITLVPTLDCSDGYCGDVEIRFFLKTGIE